jgi:uncharacterized membrane protein YkvA (DUF1232 family)
MGTTIDLISNWAKRIKRDAMTLWFACKHPLTPWHAKALGFFVVAYALSPIDLIPEFIPVLGYLDDAILLPLLIWLTMRLLPTTVVTECRAQAEAWLSSSRAKPRSLAGAALIVGAWLAVALAVGLWMVNKLG